MKRVVLNEELEVISNDGSYAGIFQDSGIEEITFPSTLREIDRMTFFHCKSLGKIYVRRGCRADLSRRCTPSSAQIVWIND